MAITTTALASDNLWPNSSSPHNITGNFTVQPLDTIQGQMITAQLDLDELQYTVMNDADIKSRLLNALALELLSAKCIEFTKQHDVATNTMKVRARIFATPDSQVRLMRQATK